jgi:N-acetylmuramic acid 6-phosphate etherase
VRWFLGIDSGGSKCDAVLIDETGTVRGWGRGGPTNYRPLEVIQQSYADALQGALGSSQVGELWVGLVGHGGLASQWLAEHGLTAHLVNVGEVEASYAAAALDWGLIVLAGTGSFVHGRTPQGRELHLGGWGPVLGDEGSAYDIGLRGLRTALRSTCSATLHTGLTDALLRALGCANPWMIVHLFHTHQLGRYEIAALAPVVEEQARAADPQARALLKQAATDLAALVALALQELGVAGAGYPLIGMGGLIQGSPLYWQELAAAAQAHDPTLRPLVPPVRAAVGAALAAMRHNGLPITAALRDRILETQRSFPQAQVATQAAPPPACSLGGEPDAAEALPSQSARATG